MSKWRPDNWEKTAFNLGFATPYKCQSNELRAFSDGVEVGADAMLEALKEYEIPPEIIDPLLRFGTRRECDSGERGIWYQGIKGKLVFIPDEGE